MTLEEYLEHGTEDGIEMGVESDWLECGLIAINSGRLAVLDPTLFEGPIIDLSPGDYRIGVKIWDTGTDRRISRLRVADGEEGRLGTEIGAVGVDFGQVGVGDWEALSVAADTLSKTDEEEIIAALDAVSLSGMVPWGPKDGAVMLWVKSGYGDGNYPVYGIIHDGKRIGVEVVFIGQDGQPPRHYAERFAADFPAFARFLESGLADRVEKIEPPADPTEIEAAEASLGVPLPLSYKAFFLLTRGVSVQHGQVQLASGHAFWYDFGPLDNLPQRQREHALSGGGGRWPPQSQGMLCFADFCMTGDGDQVLFDVKGGLVDGEYPVWYWDHERPAAYQIAEGFRDWLERVVSGGGQQNADTD